MKVTAVVPSYNPDEGLLAVLEGLTGAGFTRILLVDDGSAAERRPIFEKAAAMPQVTLLRHETNKGKGRALKTAFAQFVKDPGESVGVVTLDGDGQHHAEDVARVARMLEERPDTLVLGARDFSQSHVPKKSAWGNKITRGVFRVVCGMPISDTQTGLRGIPAGFAEKLLAVSGERYEFETNMLLETRRMAVPVAEVPITTIYIENNASSHFRPLLDSLRIYLLILVFAFSSLASSLVDLALFTLLNALLAGLPAAQRLLVATVGARLCSALFNFFVNHAIVFSSSARKSGALLRYGLLAAAQMLCSYGGTWLLSGVLPLPALPAKIITDSLLFFASFHIQKRWVFKTGR